MKIETMSKDERSLILFFEDCGVNKAGKVDCAHMNKEDVAIAKRWTEEGFVEFGRICAASINATGPAHYVRLNPEAQAIAAQERAARADRLWASRNWKTAKENRES